MNLNKLRDMLRREAMQRDVPKPAATVPPLSDSGPADPMVQAAVRVLTGIETAGNRMRLAVGLLLTLVFVLALVLASLAPLKERVPYFIAVNDSTGEVTAARQAAREFTPAEANIRFHLRAWLVDLLRVDPYLTSTELLPRSSAMIRGPQGRAQFDKWLKDDQPIQRLAAAPGMRRDVRVINLGPVAGARNTWLARVELSTRDGSQQRIERKLVTISFIFDPPRTDQEIDVNPLGLFVADFTIQGES